MRSGRGVADPARGEPVDEPAYLTEAFTREAVAYIDRHRKDPFFLYLAFNAVHTPLQAMNKYVHRFAHIKDERHRVLAAMTSAMDHGIGAVPAKLKSSGIDKDTLVIFLSDNGCPIYTKAGTNGPLLGSKLTLFEGGVRVPFLMQFPERIRAGSVYRNPIVSRDLAAPLNAVMLLSPDARLSLVLLAPLSALLASPFGVAPAAIQQMMPNPMRGQASSLYLFVNSMVGLGLGPTAVALITDYVFHNDAMVGYSLLAVDVSGAMIAAPLFWLGRQPFLRSLDRLRQWTAEHS